MTIGLTAGIIVILLVIFIFLFSCYKRQKMKKLKKLGFTEQPARTAKVTPDMNVTEANLRPSSLQVCECDLE